MQSLAQHIALLLCPRDVVTLRGEVGAGKTSFARALIDKVAVTATEVTSPTFTLMQAYDVKLSNGATCTLWHLDLYRLEREKEAEMLGLEELWDQIVLIEWPELIEKRLPAQCLDIRLDFDVSGQARSLILRGNDVWQKRLEKLK
jgi:tRNA threonylcarbamoyladenosine biosynthesis protein TsaE